MLAGAPIDTDAGNGPIKRMAHASPISLYEELVALGGGLMRGKFMLQGWKNMTCPLYLLAGAADDITTPEQVLGAKNYVGTPRERIVEKTVPGGHIGLFMGARTLKEDWPKIARWIAAQKA